MARVLIPTALRPYVDNQDTLSLQASTVGELIEKLITGREELRRHLVTPEGKLRSFVNIYVNDEDIRYLQRELTPLGPDDTVTIVPSIAGGSATASDLAIELSSEELQRYSRHLLIPEIGTEGQKKLKRASVLLVGAGGLGSPMALYLAAAGVGRIGLVDFDRVDLTNLHRQLLHRTSDLNRSKLESAAETLRDVNPHVTVELHPTLLSSQNALEILRNYDIVADGTDNFPTRYLVNDACVLLGKPNVYGSIFRFEGQASVFAFPGGPCYRCLYPEPPPPGLVPSCAESGVLGVLPGLIGLIQATEVIKLILGIGKPLVGRLLLYDALRMSFRELRIRPNPDCPVCGERPVIRELIDYHQFCGVPAPDSQSGPKTEAEIDVFELKRKLDRGDRFLLLDVREPHEYQICRLPGSVLIPVREVARRLHELDPAQEIVVYCRSGGRSAKVVDLLRNSGFTHVRNLVGGILAWSEKIDPSVPKY